MNKYLPLFFIFSFCFIGRSQSALVESDSIPNKIVLYVPNANNTQLTALQGEFVNYPQIQNAVYIAGHKCILIDMATVNNPRFYTYGQLIKIMVQYMPHKDIRIKTPSAYDQIKNDQDNAVTVIK